MFRRIPASRQHDITDCGAACLHSVARYYGLRIPLARIRQFARTDREGTNVLGMIEAADRLGFQAKGVRANETALSNLPMPVIAHVVQPTGVHHFVVVYRVRKGSMVIMDPAEGRVVRIPGSEFIERWTGVLILIVPGESFQPAKQESTPIGRFWQLVRPHRSVMLEAMAGAALYTILGLATAIYVQKIVDHVLIDGNRKLLNLLSLGMVGIVVVRAYLGSIKSLLTLRTGQKIDAVLILGYYRHILRLPQSFFDTMRVGELVSRVNDAVKIRAFINDVALDLMVNLLIVLFSFALMFTISWKLALSILALLPAYAAVHHVTNRINRRVLRRVMEEGAELESQLVESIGGIITVKRLGLEKVAHSKTELRFVRLLRSVYRAASTGIFSSAATELISGLAVILLFWSGSLQVLDRELTPGELMSFYALIGYLTVPAAQLVLVNRTVQDALIASDRLFEIMDLEIQAPTGTIVLPSDFRGDLCFDGVIFRYGNRLPLFQGLDLIVRGGETTAIVGESGSGKSTLMALVQNLYSLDAGKITLGGYDLVHLDPGTLRARIGVVPQEIQLFAGTLLENIAPHDPEPDLVHLLEICERLGITDFAERLPFGFHTPIGENGVSLSGGERQRVAIARALYRDPAILILDEATSHLDAASEAHVQSALTAMRQESCTIVLITHRLASVIHADAIVVLEGGRVVESGSHSTLIGGDGAYHRLWRAQHPDFEGASALLRST